MGKYMSKNTIDHNTDLNDYTDNVDIIQNNYNPYLNVSMDNIIQIDHNLDLNEYADNINNIDIIQKKNIFPIDWNKIILCIEIAKTDMLVSHTSKYMLDL